MKGQQQYNVIPMGIINCGGIGVGLTGKISHAWVGAWVHVSGDVLGGYNDYFSVNNDCFQ